MLFTASSLAPEPLVFIITAPCHRLPCQKMSVVSEFLGTTFRVTYEKCGAAHVGALLGLEWTGTVSQVRIGEPPRH